MSTKFRMHIPKKYLCASRAGHKGNGTVLGKKIDQYPKGKASASYIPKMVPWVLFSERNDRRSSSPNEMTEGPPPLRVLFPSGSSSLGSAFPNEMTEGPLPLASTHPASVHYDEHHINQSQIVLLASCMRLTFILYTFCMHLACMHLALITRASHVHLVCISRAARIISHASCMHLRYARSTMLLQLTIDEGQTPIYASVVCMVAVGACA